MSWFEPSRIPAWLAPVCEERSGSHSISLCEPSASHFAMCGALPSRIARRSTGNASPSISRKTIPGTSVRVAPPWRFAIRWTTRSVYVSSSFVEKITSSTTLTAATTSAASSAQPKLSTSNDSRMSLPILSATALAISTRMKPSASMNGSRSAARSGGMIALMAATTAAIARAPPVSTTSTPGRSRAVAHRETAVRTHEISSRERRKRGRSGCQRTVSPYPLIRARASSPPSFPRAALSARRPFPSPRCRTRR